jgi:hypothetical protein
MEKILGFALLFLVGCKPFTSAPPTTHWGRTFIGDELYCDSNGKKAASIINGQVCIFLPQDELTCEYFEHNRQAIEYAVKHTYCPLEGK